MASHTYVRPLLRLSLRELFVVVAFLAMAIVSLKYASTVWQIVLGLLVLVVFIGALVGAIVDRGRRQAFAISMVAAMGVYQATLINTGMGKDFNSEFLSDGASVRLPTTRLLRSLHTVVVVTTNASLLAAAPVLEVQSWCCYSSQHDNTEAC